MPINLIDPNNKKATDAVNNTTFYGAGRFHKTNSIPQSENLYIYVEMIATQYKNSTFISNSNASDPANQTTPNSTPINLIGYTQDGKNKNRFETFDGNWERDGVYSDFNGFGIKSLNIKNGLNYITTVDVTFVDARKGESLNGKPYGFLLSSYPPPIYTLKVKGYYGRGVSFQLMMSSIPKMSLSPETGFMEIQCSFVSNTWRPLGNVTVGDIFMLPFLSNSGTSKKIDLKSKTPPKSFYEFYLRAKSLYNDLVVIKETSVEERRIAEIKGENVLLNNLISYRNNYINQLPSGINPNGAIQITQNIINNNVVYAFDTTPNIILPIREQLEVNYKTFMANQSSSNIIQQIGVLPFSTLILTETTINSTATRLSVDFSDYTRKIDDYIKKNEAEIARLNAIVSNQVNEALGNRIGVGFKPTVRAIIKLICDDVDEYFNILRNANEEAYKYHKNNTPQVDNGNGGVDAVQPFPVYGKKEFYLGNTTPRLVQTWPSDQPNWKEHKLVQNFYKAYTYRRIADVKEEEARKQRINEITITDGEATVEATKGSFDALKHELYYRLKMVVDTHIKPYEQKSANYSYPNNANTPLIDKFRFTDRGGNDIGDIMILDFLVLNNLDIMTVSVWSLINTLLNRNKINCHPIENFINYSINDWSNAFEPFDAVDIDTSPSFYCMYVGGISSHGQSDVVDAFNFGTNNVPPDYSDKGDVYAFKIGYGEQNQNYFKTLQCSTSEHTVTKESIMMMDDISKRGGTAIPSLQGQSLYNIYRTYSYTTSHSMMGCMSIQPTQYFDLNNIPVFSGVYMITEVSHSISADSIMQTDFKGVRVGRYVMPIMRDFATSVEAILDGINANTNYPEINDEITSRSPIRLIRKTQFEYRNNTTDPLFDDSTEIPTDYYLINPLGLANRLKTGLGIEYIFTPLGNNQLPDVVYRGNFFSEFK